MIKYLRAAEAVKIDEILMSKDLGQFSLDQLMELAGLSIAQAFAHCFPLGPPLPPDQNGIKQKRTNERILVACGPGNQGGDGLVAARHLDAAAMFGYAPSVFYPKESKGEIFPRLKAQLQNLSLPLIAPPLSSNSSFAPAPDAQENAFKRALSQSDVVLDCVFGFSYKPPPRAPFKVILQELIKTSKPIVSVDIPSGWDVELGKDGESPEGYIDPEVIISLTAPKLGVKKFAEGGGKHYLGGRFISPELAEEFKLNLPPYEGTDQFVDITIEKKEGVTGFSSSLGEKIRSVF